MFMKRPLKQLLLAATLSVVSALSFAKETFLVVDILPLREGKTLADAQDYFDKVEPIFRRYDFKRADKPLKVATIARGNIEADVINLWKTSDPNKAFKGIFSDADYLLYVKDRDAIFNLAEATVLVTER